MTKQMSEIKGFKKPLLKNVFLKKIDSALIASIESFDRVLTPKGANSIINFLKEKENFLLKIFDAQHLEIEQFSGR